ncbi:autotransporter outer membrane beta-barrel domain-containing protein [Pragia fontium]|uniref:autotransporter outer membrane beta-barrel domain-containing protein n=1 Tax=Pragia fontium TaxID=82985 RepID=UPI000F6FB7E8|nr:autotransporter outer membrane beta-barrel domain-containing protein [Pragia fontium]VEJ54970.1 Adhesin/invasin TibA autotransporter precursor [Pragia fontium]
MEYGLRKTYLSLVISSIFTASLSVSAYAAPCGDDSITQICEQDKFAAGEFYTISPGDGVSIGSEDNHFVLNGDGYERYDPLAHFYAEIVSGTVKYTEMNNSRLIVSGMTADDATSTRYDGRAENTTLNDSLMWVTTTADQTVAKGKSEVIVSTQFAKEGSTWVQWNDDGSVFWSAPLVTNSRYYDTSGERIRGIKREDKNWDTLAVSQNSVFFDSSHQTVLLNGHSIDAEFNDNSAQQVEEQGLSSGARFYGSASQLISEYGEAKDTSLNDHAYSRVNVRGLLSGTTQVNDAAILYMDTAGRDGAVADKVVLNGENSALVVNYSDENDAFATVNELNMIGGTVSFENGGADNYVNLHLGSLSGSGVFNFNTTLNQGKGNTLFVDNASGSHKVMITDSGEEITSAENLTLNIINDKSSGADFSLASISGENIAAVDGGTYMYSLKQQSGKDGLAGNVWYLGADWQADQEPEPEPEITTPLTPPIVSKKTTPSTDAVLNMASASQFIFDGELQTLRQRKGDLKTGVGHDYGTWGRYLTNNTRVETSSGAAYKLQQDGLEIGVDKAISLAAGKLVLGGFTAYSNNKLKNARGGNSDIDSYSLGVYATYLDNLGYYLDGVIKANRFNHSLNARMTSGNTAKSEYHQNAIGAAIETGYNYQAGWGMFIEPYLRASYFSAESKSITLNNGMKADIDQSRSAKGEAGVTVGKAFDLNNGAKLSPYVRAAIEREFIRSNKVRINQRNDFNNDFSGDIGKYGVGLSAQITAQTSLYMEMDYRKGSQVETPIEGNLGFRINF